MPCTAPNGGVAQLTKALEAELGAFGIGVNSIAPGVIETPMTACTLSDPAKIGALLNHVPMRRHAQPEELAGPAVFLCSPLASYVTGPILPVDGGYLSRFSLRCSRCGHFRLRYGSSRDPRA